MEWEDNGLFDENEFGGGKNDGAVVVWSELENVGWIVFAGSSFTGNIKSSPRSIKSFFFSGWRFAKFAGADWFDLWLFIESPDVESRRECASNNLRCSAISAGETYHRFLSYF